ncbi:MAG TPA: hypothetical protein DCE41_26210 [Cytophagales bacterium]|nr:hypothetical protein [Cytophagales bacterium]HAA22421.1 hypothetical protein [Cytophagales bacterium]HAP59731.1 hypothetical protein [Cytophagales bacterium]
MQLITIKDESATGDILNEIQIQIDQERTTVKDLIAARVTAEVRGYNEKNVEYYKGLVQPRDAEVTLNGFKLKKRRKLDAEKQIYKALEAFQQNGYFVLVDNLQCEDMDQEVLVNNQTTVSFIKLTPLVGG